MAVSGALPQGYDEIDPIFLEDFEALGGENILGPAISPSFEKNGVRYQYTSSALLVRDPNAPQNRVFHLAALGLDMGVAEPPIPPPENPDGRYVEGHVIHSAFLPTYDRLKGQRYVGLPLTELHYNPAAQRYEQYFENLGMYWLESEGSEQVHLLSYGAWKCNASCLPLTGADPGLVVLPIRTAEIFRDAVARLGSDFTGFAIKDALLTPDGYTEQVFENVVLVSDPDTPSRIFVRPIIERLGIKADPLTEASGKDGFEFYPLQEGLGYNIPVHFLEYIARHGGMDASGQPITELFQVNPGVERQCFTNLCLEMQRTATGEISVHPSQFGYNYKMLPVRPVGLEDGSVASPSLQDPAVNATPDSQAALAPQATAATMSQPQTRELTMRVWESYPTLAPNQNQEIGVNILENGIPMPNIEPYLQLIFPDGQEREYLMFPTGENGVSKILLDPIDLPNGSLVEYRVCMLDPTHEKYCVRDSYLIWQNH
jgi:hypothetical protein